MNKCFKCFLNYMPSWGISISHMHDFLVAIKSMILSVQILAKEKPLLYCFTKP